MSDDLNPGDLVAGLQRGDESDRDRLRRLCSEPIGLLIDRIRGGHPPGAGRMVSADLTLGRVEMDLRARPATCFEGMPTPVFLALILASTYRMLAEPEADGPRMQALGVDDEAALARFVAGHATKEERVRLSGAMLTQPELRRWIETVRDVLDARPSVSPALTPDPASPPETRELIGRYIDVAERYLRSKLGDANQADEVYLKFWTKFLTHTLAVYDRHAGRFRDYLRAVLDRLIVEYLERKKLPPPIPEESLDAPRPDTLFDRLWREALIVHAMSRLEAYEASTPGNVFHTVLMLRRSHPRAPIEDLAAQLSGQIGEGVTPEAFRKALQGARDRFIELLIEEIRDTVDPDRPGAIEDELRDLGLGHLR